MIGRKLIDNVWKVVRLSMKEEVLSGNGCCNSRNIYMPLLSYLAFNHIHLLYDSTIPIVRIHWP